MNGNSQVFCPVSHTKSYWVWGTLLLIAARLKTRHAQYDFWAINILCILAVVGCLHTTWKKELRSVLKWQFWPTCSFHCMLCCSDSESKLWSHVSNWITSCKINFWWFTYVLFEKFFRNLCTVQCTCLPYNLYCVGGDVKHCTKPCAEFCC